MCLVLSVCPSWSLGLWPPGHCLLGLVHRGNDCSLMRLSVCLACKIRIGFFLKRWERGGWGRDCSESLCSLWSLAIFSLIQARTLYLFFFEHAFTRAYIGDVPLLETVPLLFWRLFMTRLYYCANTLQNTISWQNCWLQLACAYIGEYPFYNFNSPPRRAATRDVPLLETCACTRENTVLIERLLHSTLVQWMTGVL